MINIKSKKDYIVALESVAMTDIVLNMFIFFFISFSLLYTFNADRMSKIIVRLPRASGAMSIEGNEKSVIAINKRGEYFLNDEKISIEKMKNALMDKMKSNPEIGIMLKVDAVTRFENVVKVIDMINTLGIQQISIASSGAAAKKADR